ncbi:MAG: family 20 glycosylhydrolase [Microscillaceae bacterium]|nr:family 20 glycosylhydrolase [Microscillaceae bacterium]
MKILGRLLKYIFLGLLAFLLLAVLGLLLYYESLYEKAPELSESLSLRIIPADPLQVKPTLVPIPKIVRWIDESCTLPKTWGLSIPAEDKEKIEQIALNRLKIPDVKSGQALVKVSKDQNLAAQEYHLKVRNSGVEITYSQLEGLFYAFSTLKQLIDQSVDNTLPGVEIVDKPDLEVRGVMLDISRNKIPKLETLYQIIDFLADLKYNHLQLYIEGFSFAYPSFKSVWQSTETPLTPEEIQQLDRYCKDRYIELVPNQNSLGHMMSWLASNEFDDLAECPDGFKLLGLLDMKGTLNPTDPRSLELVKKMTDDLLPHFSSDKLNVNLDEPFELGHCRSKEAAQKAGGSEMLYLEYTQKLLTYVKSKGKKMMMWGDVISKHPEIISKIPKEITLLEWGYEFNHPFEQNCQRYQKAKLPYMVCPGTSSWSSYTGRTQNMMGNIDNAVHNGILYGAKGMLLTDWGDMGHHQYLTVSYAGLAYGAALSWNHASKQEVALSTYLSRQVFEDESGLMGNLVLNMGTYNQFEEIPMVAGTTTAFALQLGFMDKVMIQAINRKIQGGIMEMLPLPGEIKDFYQNSFKNPQPYNHQAVFHWLDSLQKQLDKVKLKVADADLIRDEYRNALRMIRFGAKIKQYNNYHSQQNREENISLLQEMKTLSAQIIQEHERLWLLRNKPGRLDLSLAAYKKMQNQIVEKLASEQKSGIGRWFGRMLEKLSSAGAALYLG